MISSAPNQDKSLKIWLKINSTNEHLFYNYFVSLHVGSSFPTLEVFILLFQLSKIINKHLSLKAIYIYNVHLPLGGLKITENLDSQNQPFILIAANNIQSCSYRLAMLSKIMVEL